MPDRPTACLTFDFDALSVWLSRGGATPSALSRGEFGARVGLGRILALLERESVAATFYVPGHTVDTYPHLCREIVERGHEIGHHGYLHESPADLDAPEERRVIERGLEAIDRAVGVRAVGYRSPGWELSAASIDLLLEYGFEYDSSMMAQDFELYRCRQGDVPNTDGPYLFGPEVDLVEVPVSWSLDDYPQMEFVKSFALPGLSGYDKTLGMWTTDFDYMVENVPGGVFGITFHPQVIGRGGRMRILEGLIAHMKETDTSFRRVVDVVRDWRAAHPFADGVA